MQKVIALILSLLALPAMAENFAIIMGGAAQYERNEFTDNMTDYAEQLEQRGWQTKVLFDSDLYSEDWKKFPKQNQPKVVKDTEYYFTMENYKRELKNIAKKAKKNDQVFISFSAHGGNILRHSAVWGGGYPDGIDGNIFALAWNEIKHSETTEQILYQMEDLLKKGVRVGVDIHSCYDGEIFNDVEDLLEKYPGQICLTSAATGDRPAGNYNTFLDSFTKDDKVMSMADHFMRSSGESGQISFLLDWLKIQEEVDDKLDVTKSTRLNPRSTGVDPELLCKYAGLDSAILKSLKEHLTHVLDGLTNEQEYKKYFRKLSSLCSTGYNHSLNFYTFKKVWQAEKKILKGNKIKILRSDFPELFSNSVINGKTFLMCGGNSKTSTVERGDQTYCTKELDDIIELIDDKDYPEISEGMQEYIKNNSLEQHVKDMRVELERINAEIQSKSCNQQLLADVKAKLREKYYKQAKESKAHSPDSQQAKLLKACEDFKL